MQHILPILLLLAVQGYLLYRMQRWLLGPVPSDHTKWIRGAGAGLFLYSGSIIIFMIVNRFPEEPLSASVLYGLVYPFWLWIFPSTLVICPIFLFRDLAMFVARRRSPGSPGDPGSGESVLSRRQFLRFATAGIVTAPVAMTTYGAVVGTQRYDIRYQDISFTGLPDSLEGLRLLQLSDVHANMFMTLEDMRDIVGLVNDIPVDMIVLTGDYVTGTAEFIHPFCEAFRKMRVPAYGVHATLGNHDHWTDEDQITGALTDIGMNVLRNRTTVIPVDDTHMNLIGIDYGGLKSGSRLRRERTVTWPAISGLLDEAEQTARPGGFDILLSHSPWGFHQAIARDIPLTLSGHTHGGQVVLRLPGLSLSPATLLYPYTEGLYRRSGSSLYVNRGCGTTGPPVRINCKPEITVITLKRTVS